MHLNQALGGRGREERCSGEKLGGHAAEGPQIDLGGIGLAEHHLGGPVKSALQVSMDLVTFKAGRTEVYQLYRGLALALKENVFRFDVSMHDSFGSQVLQCF